MNSISTFFGWIVDVLTEEFMNDLTDCINGWAIMDHNKMVPINRHENGSSKIGGGIADRLTVG